MTILCREIIVWGLAAIGLLDLTSSLLSIYHMEKKLPRLFRWSQNLQQWTLRLGTKISQRMENRIRPLFGKKSGKKAIMPAAAVIHKWRGVIWVF